MTGRELTFLWITLEVNRQFGASNSIFGAVIITPLSADRPAEQTARACVLIDRAYYVDGSIMNQSEFRNYHEREAARLRSLLAIRDHPDLKGSATERSREPRAARRGV